MLYILGSKLSKLQNSKKSTIEFFAKHSNEILPLIDWKLCILCAIWYLTSVISSSSTKSILKIFSYPVTLTEIQFLMNAGFCLLTVSIIKKYDSIFASHRHHMNPNSLYAEQDIGGSLLSRFPKGTFPMELNSYSYSITQDFLKPSMFVLKTTLPMGIFQFVGHIASHKATSIIPVSLVHTIKALSPLTTVLIYRFMFGQNFNYKTYLTLIPLVVGVMLSCIKNHNVTLKDDLFYEGCVFAFISMMIFVSQNIFAKKILTFDSSSLSSNNKESNKQDYFINRLNSKIVRTESATTTPILPISMTPKNMSPPITPLLGNSSQSLNKLVQNSEKKLDKISVLFYCSIVGFILTLPFYLLSELTSTTGISINLIDSNLSLIFIINGLSHFVQSIVAFQILGLVSPINYSIANILKRIIIISCSILVEGTKLCSIQWIGLGLTFVGLYCYDKWGVQRKK
ncbi:hypothetical protein CANARDRAFT_231783 [[Candida] arabinofermentans NRRL YB-2248]|uniref:Sugar phosphate transporter domain-containing protein n=1 Tax=[Candida] arabinofermentans NRRL YB-2248 TaxID=983967 RepID=A0A1E4T3E9_9ASCO|nr:hypothetical protein CANARDRAFT_231783 [[Candida] arabinofermentans NRRL YB-2248]